MEFNIIYHVDSERTDFNLRNVPYEIILPLVNALRWEHQKQFSARCAPSFKEERALQHERHVQDALSKGETPRQYFIDFPIL